MNHVQFDADFLYRLARAVHLDADRTGYGHCYLVRSQDGQRQYFVNLERDECSCEDHARGHLCKHRIRAMLAEGDESILKRLRWFIPMPNSRRRLPAKV